MKKFLENNFTIIVLVIAILSFFKSCGDSRDIAKIKTEIKAIKDSTYTKTELDRELKISGRIACSLSANVLGVNIFYNKSYS